LDRRRLAWILLAGVCVLLGFLNAFESYIANNSFAESNPPSTSAKLELTALATPQGLALRSMLLKSGADAMHVTFKPELQMTLDSAAPGNTEVAFQIDQGNHEKVAQGTLIQEKQGDTMLL
jgi:hypothetical protein